MADENEDYEDPLNKPLGEVTEEQLQEEGWSLTDTDERLETMEGAIGELEYLIELGEKLVDEEITVREYIEQVNNTETPSLDSLYAP